MPPGPRKQRAIRLSEPLIAGHAASHHFFDNHIGSYAECDLVPSPTPSDKMAKFFFGWFCCGERSVKPKRERTRRRHRKKHAQAASTRAAGGRNDLGGVAASIASGNSLLQQAHAALAMNWHHPCAWCAGAESEYHDAREVFSMGDGGKRRFWQQLLNCPFTADWLHLAAQASATNKAPPPKQQCLML